MVVADDAVPTPTCPPEDVAACETWPEGAWASGCPCIANDHAFGTVKVRTSGPAAADAIVDLPAPLWSVVRLANGGEGQDASDPALHCDATFELGEDVDGVGVAGNEFPWELHVTTNVPSAAVTMGPGYLVDVASSGCAPVAFTEDPADYACLPDAAPQPTQERGNLHACNGCIRTQSCEKLLGG